jgi:iron-sulfur cluster repair protein YtfE (RIC family)
MLVQIGRRPPELDVVDLLAGCHERIRRFTRLAYRLASSPGVSADEARDTAAQIARYFTAGFPLHIADEDVSIVPRLRGRDPELDLALARMQSDHVDHLELIDRLVACCEIIVRDPRQLATCTRELDTIASRLALELEAHLGLEELVIFDALRALPAAEQAAIHSEMRLRRELRPT